jgi:sporulation protein YlmC with PRC-barrel domain
MNIQVSSVVECRDGSLGRVASVITDPDSLRVTHLVITYKHQPDHGRVVPISMIDRCAGEKLQLSCTASDMRTLRPFNRDEFAGSSYEHPLYAPHEHLIWRYTTLVVPEAHLLLPHRTGAGRHVVVRRGYFVYTVDGYAGQVEKFVVHTPSQRITHLVLTAENTPGDGIISVSIDAIKHVSDEIVYLSVSKAALASQPSLPVRCSE